MLLNLIRKVKEEETVQEDKKEEVVTLKLVEVVIFETVHKMGDCICLNIIESNATEGKQFPIEKEKHHMRMF